MKLGTKIKFSVFPKQNAGYRPLGNKNAKVGQGLATNIKINLIDI